MDQGQGAVSFQEVTAQLLRISNTTYDRFISQDANGGDISDVRFRKEVLQMFVDTLLRIVPDD